MPILAFGRFTARSSADAGFVRGQAITFTFVPWYLALWSGAAVLLGILARIFWRTRLSYSKSRYLVFVPAVMGVAIAAFANWSYVRWLCPVPLEAITVAFVLWRLLRVRNRLLAALLAVAGGIALSAVHLAADLWRMNALASWGLYIYLYIVPGGTAGVAMAGIRLVLRDRATWKRILLGLGIGCLITLGSNAAYAVWFSTWQMGNSWEFIYAAYSIGVDVSAVRGWSVFPVVPLAISAVLLIAFARWSVWARDVATGAMFHKT